jgi:hypothetical protein
MDTMQMFADDPINRSIWTESVGLQRKISERETQPLRVGAQQAMPKLCDKALFSPECPLPWVPDLVGSRFASGRRSVMVVASSYNGFIEGYSRRAAVLPLTDYSDAKNAGVAGLDRFIASFKECVVDGDEDYYQPILRDLLAVSGCSLDNCCLTDLCKASFVQRGGGPDNGNRGDVGKDGVLKEFWPQWTPYIVGLPDGGVDAPLPYRWLWQRMQQCRAIIAMGTIAEYGVLKIFQRMASAPKVWSWKDSSIVPDHPTMTARVSGWEYTYASSRRKLKDWLADEDWWVLGDLGNKPRWFMLPVHHPSSAIGRGNDTKYQKTVPRAQRMMEQAAMRL